MSDSAFFRTIGFLAQRARFEAMVPQHLRNQFEHEYREVTGIEPIPGHDGYYLHEKPVDKWGYELRLTFHAESSELEALDFGPHKVRIRKGTAQNEHRINSNKLIRDLWARGFRNGHAQNPRTIMEKVPERHRLAFQQGLGVASDLVDLEELGRLHNRLLDLGAASGEGEEHLQLKRFVAANGTMLGLDIAADGVEEYQFISGDRCDVVFDLRDLGAAVVEIKPEILGDLVRGVHQAIKYRALMEAEKGRGEPFDVVAILVSHGIPDEIVKYANRFGIQCQVVTRSSVKRWKRESVSG